MSCMGTKRVSDQSLDDIRRVEQRGRELGYTHLVLKPDGRLAFRKNGKIVDDFMSVDDFFSKYLRPPQDRAE